MVMVVVVVVVVGEGGEYFMSLSTMTVISEN